MEERQSVHPPHESTTTVSNNNDTEILNHATESASTNERDCWKTARERNRHKARYTIQQRILHHQDEILETADSCNNKSIIQTILQNVIHGNRSYFSLQCISKQHSILNAVFPVSYLYTDDDEVLFIGQEQLRSRLGRERYTIMLEYFKQKQATTILEYTVVVQRYFIVSALLLGGIRADSSCNSITLHDEIGYELHTQRIPLQLSTYVYTVIYETRIQFTVNKYGKQQSKKDKGEKQEQCCCDCCKTTKDLLLKITKPKFIECCSASFCETCWWEYFLNHRLRKSNTTSTPTDSILGCPVCHKDLTEITTKNHDTTSSDSNDDNDTNESSSSSLLESFHELLLQNTNCITIDYATIKKRRQHSLKLYQKLPKDTKELKLRNVTVTKKNKTFGSNSDTTESQYLSGSGGRWFRVIVSSLIGKNETTTQLIRYDRLMRYSTTKNYYYYTPFIVYGCLVHGVDVNQCNEYGQTPLFLVVWNYANFIIYSSNVHPINSSSANDTTTREEQQQQQYEYYCQTVKVLLEYGSNPFQESHGGYNCITILLQQPSYYTTKMYEFICRYNDPMNDVDDDNSRTKYNTPAVVKKFVVEDNDDDESSYYSSDDDDDDDYDPIANTRTVRRIRKISPRKILVEAITAATIVGNNNNNDFDEQVQFDMVIPWNSPHVGAGSFIIDAAITRNVRNALLQMYKSIPNASVVPPKNKLCSIRSYYCDAEYQLTTYMATIIQHYIGSIPRDDTKDTVSPSRIISVLPHMRFLCYTTPGTTLAPHVDLNRIDTKTGISSTHSFLLYLTTCTNGGETALLHQLPSSKQQQTANSNLNIITKVQPVTGRLLVFPHATPHSGLAVKSAPKLLLRGEVIIQ